MNFKIIYRNTNGEVVTEYVSAINRTECFDKLKARKITPFSVEKDIILHPDRNVPSINSKRIFLFISLLSVIITVVFLLTKRHPTIDENIPKTRIIHNNTTNNSPIFLNLNEDSNIRSNTVTPPKMKMVIGYTAGQCITNWVPLYSGEKIKSRKKRIFTNGIEEQLSWIFELELGDAPPVMLPRISRRNMQMLDELLSHEIVISPDDSEREKQSKLRMKEVKKALKEYVDEGGTIEAFIEYYHSELKHANKQWQIAKKSVIDLYRTDRDPDLLKSYILKVNNTLISKGIKPLTLPNEMLKEIGLNYEIDKVKEKTK